MQVPADPRRLRRPLRPPLLILATVYLGVGLMEAALLVDGPGYGPLWVLLLFILCGWTYAAAGLQATWRRPSNRFGIILLVGGAGWLSAGLYNTGVPPIAAFGGCMAEVTLAVIVHLLNAFPSGRLPDRASRVIVVIAYVNGLVIQLPRILFEPGDLEIANRPDVTAHTHDVQETFWSFIMIIATVLVVRRARAYQRPQRRVALALLITAILSVFLEPLSKEFNGAVLGLGPIGLLALQLLLLTLVPIAFAVAGLRGGFARAGEIDELGAWLASYGLERPALGEALAATLGDSSVELLFFTPTTGEYVDAAGVVTTLPVKGNRRYVPIESGSRQVGAVVYDTDLNPDQGIVREAAAVIAIAVDHERLTAELRASEASLLASSARVVKAGEQERRRIAQDLHDGLQADLVLLALEAERIAYSSDPAAEAHALRRRLDAAAADLRALVHGVMPALLIERGLYAAVEDLADRLPISTTVASRGHAPGLNATIESSAYFLVAEALSNAVKHSAAQHLNVVFDHQDQHLRITVADDGVGGATPGRGAGLTGIADRLGILGGRVELSSPVGRGTTVMLELPCA